MGVTVFIFIQTVKLSEQIEIGDDFTDKDKANRNP